MQQAAFILGNDCPSATKLCSDRLEIHEENHNFVEAVN